MTIRATALTKHYGQIAALEDCSLTVDRGEVVGLLGPNGAGKSTLIRLLLGFLKPTRGSAAVDNFDCYRQPMEVHRRLAYLPGEPRLFRSLTGRDTLKFFSGLRATIPTRTAEQVAFRLGLDISRPVRKMSTGMRQKLALAITLAADVPLLVLDEPTSNLDPTARSTVLRLLADARQAGKTLLVSSHVLSEVEASCDRVIILRNGKIAANVQISEIRQQHRITAQLTGEFVKPTESLAKQLAIEQRDDGLVSITTSQSLEPLLDWLAKQPLAELRIEPVGLQAIYEQYHEAE